MATDLFPCPGCARHVRRSNAVCPFCGTDVVEAARVAPVRRYPAQRMRRAASFAFGAAAIGAAGCSETHAPPADTGPDTFMVGSDAAAYGAPDAGLPDAPTVDAGGPTDAGATDDTSDFDAALDAGGSVLLYGGPPEP